MMIMLIIMMIMLIIMMIISTNRFKGYLSSVKSLNNKILLIPTFTFALNQPLKRTCKFVFVFFVFVFVFSHLSLPRSDLASFEEVVHLCQESTLHLTHHQLACKSHANKSKKIFKQMHISIKQNT